MELALSWNAASTCACSELQLYSDNAFLAHFGAATSLRPGAFALSARVAVGEGNCWLLSS